MGWQDYKGYKDIRGNNIDFIDGKWQIYDDGGYYVRSENMIPDNLKTQSAKKKAELEYKSYISDFNNSKKNIDFGFDTIKKTKNKKTKKTSYSFAEKKSYRNGILKGLRLGKRKKK